MATVDEIVAALQSVIDEINEAVNAATAAESKTDEMQTQMAAAGVQDKVSQLAAVKDAIDKVRTHLGAGVDLVNEAISLAKVVEGK